MKLLTKVNRDDVKLFTVLLSALLLSILDYCLNGLLRPCQWRDDHTFTFASIMFVICYYLVCRSLDSAERRYIEEFVTGKPYNQKDDALRIHAFRRDANSRIKIIETSCARLKELLKQVKICNAQCQNLVQTCCLEGTKLMIVTYSQLSSRKLWELYHSKKLKQLGSSLDRLMYTLHSIEGLLQGCGRRWGKMGLVLSVPVMPLGVKVFTNFDLALGELGWNLDTIGYLLDLTEDVKLTWNEDNFRYALKKKHGTTLVEPAGEMKPVESGTLVCKDRVDLLSQIKNGSIPSKLNFGISWALHFILWSISSLAASINATSKRLRPLSFLSTATCFSLEFASTIFHKDIFVVQLAKLLHIFSLVICVGEDQPILAGILGGLENFLERLWRRYLLDDGNGHHFADVLKGRLEESGEMTRLGVAINSYPENFQLEELSVLSNEFHQSVLGCFQINHMDLKTDRQIGKGGSKSIYRGKWCGLTVAVAKTDETTREAVEREALVMLKVQHPNIVGFFGWAFDSAPVTTDDAPLPVCSEESWPPRGAGYLVMELMQGDLRHVIEQRTKSERGSPFPVAIAVDILLQIARAMGRMHSLNHMHRDLKAANCLVNLVHDKAYTVKLIDFGNSKMFNPELDASYTANSGTYRWRAPEVWGPPGTVVPYTKSADVYSFGMVCYEVMTGLQPFHEDHGDIKEVKKALDTSRQPLLRIPASASCPEGIKELMSECWLLEPSARPDFKRIVKELWTIKAELEVE